MLELPRDVLLCVCEELSNKQDFGTLYNCAQTGRTLSSIAIAWLYRIHHLSPVISSEGNDAELTKNRNLKYNDVLLGQKKTFAKWALQWKSIIRSTLGKTIYPYALYIRVLDLRNLSELLEEPWFREIMDEFFANEMQRFWKAQDTPLKRPQRGKKPVYTRLNVPLILDAVGGAITSFVTESASQTHSTVALEDVSGDISASSLPQWTGRLSKLRSLTLWDGGTLNETVAIAIANNCFEFDDLTFYRMGDEQDSSLAAFLSNLRPNTLRSFFALSADGIGPETLLALNHHSESLKVLKMLNLKLNGIKNLHLLQGCINLEELEITSDSTAGFINLEATENDVFLELVAWLRKCEHLRNLSIASLVFAPSILTHVCLANNVRLQTLAVSGYPLIGNQDFHRSISHQTSLEHLELQADPEGGFRDDHDILISSISRLPRLKELNLLETSYYFRTPDVQALASNLKNVEEFSFMGYDVDDTVWPSLAGLHHLRALNIMAISTFTLDGILAFISTLKESHTGLSLSIMNQNPTHVLNDIEQTIIREAIEAKVNGTFEFVLFREADDSDSESPSD